MLAAALEALFGAVMEDAGEAAVEEVARHLGLLKHTLLEENMGCEPLDGLVARM